MIKARTSCADCFNPRARDGREFFIPTNARGRYVSIHAPVMDANILVVGDEQWVKFQSTRP